MHPVALSPLVRFHCLASVVPAGQDAGVQSSISVSSFRLQWCELASLRLLARDQLTWNELMAYCKPLPPIKELRYLLALRSDGELIWKRPRTNRVKPGSIAGRWGSRGDRYTAIGKSSYANHRLAWALHHGRDPGQYEIDHINCNPADNRPCNLRLCTRQQNNFNLRRKSNNTSGYKGVSYDPSSKSHPWRAYFMKKKLGRFATREEARDAYGKAAQEWAGEFFRPE